MSILRQGREALGWSLERMAANVLITPEELSAIEGRPVDESSVFVRSILQILQARGVKITADRVVGPIDDEAFAELPIGADDIADLRKINRCGRGGLAIDSVVVGETQSGLMWSALRSLGFLQFSTVRTTTHLNFDGDAFDEIHNSHEMRVRLSLRGKAALAYFTKRDAEKKAFA